MNSLSVSSIQMVIWYRTFDDAALYFALFSMFQHPLVSMVSAGSFPLSPNIFCTPAVISSIVLVEVVDLGVGAGCSVGPRGIHAYWCSDCSRTNSNDSPPKYSSSSSNHVRQLARVRIGACRFFASWSSILSAEICVEYVVYTYIES